MTSDCFQSSDGTAKSAAKKVAGRKPIVIIAIVFIEELFLLEASAIVRLVRASSRLNRAKIWTAEP